MKTFCNLFVFFAIIISTLFFTGCEGPEGPKGADGQDGEDGLTVPAINTIVANPPMLITGDSTTISVGYSYTGTDTLEFVWQAEHGSISGGGSSIIWTAPEEAGSYVVELGITAGEDTARGGVSLVVTADDSEVYQWMGMVYDAEENIVDAATVWESETNFTTTMSGSGYELYSENMKGTLTAHKTEYEATTITGFNTSPDFELRDFEVEKKDSYVVVVNMSAFWEHETWYEDTFVTYRIQSNICDSKVTKKIRWYSDTFAYTDSIIVPEGRQRIYCIANDERDAYFGEELVDVNSDMEIDVILYTTYRQKPIRTILQMPDVGIEKFWVEAWVDSTQNYYLGIGECIGRISIQWNNHIHYSRSTLDSIMIMDINIDNTPIVLMSNNLTLHVIDRNGNHATKTIRDVSWSTYWVNISIEGEIPVINTVNMEGGAVTFEYDGISDVYVLEVFENTASGYNRIWRGITDQRSITMPTLPTGTSLIETSGDYSYRISAATDPYYSIDDPFTIDMTEWMESDFHELEIDTEWP